MSAPPQRSSGLSLSTAAESTAAASSAFAGSKRRVDDADGASDYSALTDQQHPAAATMSDVDASAATAPSSSLPLSAPSTAAAAPCAPPSAASSAAAHKEQKHDDTAAPATSAATSVVTAPSRWSMIYSDALHSILGFASLSDLSRVLSVNRRWSAALCTMPSIRTTSVMGHVSTLSCSPTRGDGGNRLIFTVARLSNLDWLTLDLLRVAGVSFAPLSQLPSLCTFHLTVNESASAVSDEQIAELRSMTSVRIFLPWWSSDEGAEFLVRMLQPGHALQWTSLPHWLAVTAPLAPLLGSLSALTELRVSMLCSDVSFLLQLPHLTHLRMCADPYPGSAVESDELVAALSRCAQLRNLSLFAFPKLTDDHLATLMPSFPQLESLTLHTCPAVESLRFLATPALSASLTDLRLILLPRCPSSESLHLLQLHSLHQLCILAWADSLSAELRARFAVPSQRFPSLTTSNVM